MTASEVFDETFEQQVLRSAEPVLVDFFTTWCGPCKAMAPVLDEVASELSGKVKVVKVDVGRSALAREKYGVRSVPTLMLFMNGKPAARHAGALVQKHVLEAWLARALESTEFAAHQVARWLLSNGMDVIVIPDRRAPLVLHALWCKFGAADEPYGLSGLARLVERLTSKALEKVEMGHEGTGASRHVGTRAVTEQDFTCFTNRISKDRLSAAMEMETYRMTSVNVSEDDVRRELELIAEQGRSRSATSPVSILSEQVNAALYVSHPYGNPVVGWLHHTENLSRVEVERFHRRYYVPSNAVLVVSGDVVVEEIRSLVERTYGTIPANPERVARARNQEAPHIAERRVTIRNPRTTKSHLQRCYAVPSYLTSEQSEAAAIEVLARILGAGRMGRLHARLVEGTKTAVAAGARYTGAMRDSGMIMMFAASGGSDIKVLDAEFDAVIQEIREHGVTAAELEIAKRELVARFSSQNDSASELATKYGEGLALGRTMEQIDAWADAISKVTGDDVKQVAVTYLDARRSVTGWMLPAAEAAEFKQGAPLAEAV